MLLARHMNKLRCVGYFVQKNEKRLSSQNERKD